MQGSQLGHYKIHRKLGKGGMGEVYLAEDLKLGRRVALKVLPPNLAGEKQLRRFDREARLVASLSHPNIVTIFSVEQDRGVSFITMELIEGRTLEQIIPAGGLDRARLFTIALPLVAAVAAAHEKGVIHRDLKPSNVMITDSGQVKVLDFGLAKLEEAEHIDAAQEPDAATLTQDGAILGTTMYMAPEQARGEPCDARSEVFSLGVILYQMATGDLPFVGESQAELVSSILRDEPPPVFDRRPELPRQLGRIVSRCLKKEPAERFQTVRGLGSELSSLDEELRSGDHVDSAPAPTKAGRTGRRPSRPALRLAAIGLVALAAIGFWWLARDDPDRPPAPAARAGGTAAERPSLAVLHFQNLKGEEEIDWLSTGLAEMLVTDLAQSARIEVVSSERLYQTLRQMGRLGQRLTADEIAEVGRRTGVGTVLGGSFARVAGVYRISAWLRDPSTDQLAVSHSVEGAGEGSLFSLVDELSRAVRGELEAGPPPAETDRRLEEVTTASVEAYRLYLEGVNLHMQVKEAEAIVMFERALEVDPRFAMAMARLSSSALNLGDARLALEYSRRAVENADRLPGRERHYIEAKLHSRRWRTYDEAIRAFERAIELYPDHHEARHGLGLVYASLERYAEAAAQFEELRRRRYPFGGTYYSLAHVYAALADSEAGAESVRTLRELDPGGSYGHLVEGLHLALWARVDEALASFRESVARLPGAQVEKGRWFALTVGGRWDEATAAAAQLVRSDDPFQRRTGLHLTALSRLFGDRFEESMALFGQAIAAVPESDAKTAAIRCYQADALLQAGRAEEALAQAQLARREGAEQWPELEGLFHEALARQRLGSPAEADQLAAELRRRIEPEPKRVELRLADRLDANLALERGDPKLAIAILEPAVATLPARGVGWHWHRLPDQVPLWYDLARAHLAAGQGEAAAGWLRRIVDSDIEHVAFPIRWARSRDLLGEIEGGRAPRRAAHAARRLARRPRGSEPAPRGLAGGSARSRDAAIEAHVDLLHRRQALGDRLVGHGPRREAELARSYSVFTGSAGRAGSLRGSFSIMASTSAMPRSSCGSRPSR